MNAQEVFSEIYEKMKNQSGSKLVFGEPIEKGNKTIIPISKLMYGFGSGSCKFKAKESEDAEANGGSGSGGGISARPIGVLEISEEETKFIPIRDTKFITGMVLLGVLAGMLLKRRKVKYIKK